MLDTIAASKRRVDREHPTLIIDEADDVFYRKSDLRAIVNAGWSRGTKIPRQGRWYDPFCPKILGILGKTKLPRTIASRSIILKMWPKKPDVHQEADFSRHGYRAAQFEDAFALLAPRAEHPNTQARARGDVMFGCSDVYHWMGRAAKAAIRRLAELALTAADYSLDSVPVKAQPKNKRDARKGVRAFN